MTETAPMEDPASEQRLDDQPELSERIKSIARTAVLLVASDYDGTLCPIVADPAKTVPNREALVALRNLAALPHTHVAIISGRSLKTLTELLGMPLHVHLVGSHGSEFDPGFASNLPPEDAALLARLARELTAIAEAAPGLGIERKPASIAFHYRNAADGDAQKALRAILAGPAAIPGVITHHGKRVVELAVIEMSKGHAIQAIRQRVGAGAAIFLGDDLTDEDAFAVLSGPDIGIKIGDGPTVAPFRIKTTRDAARILARLYELRSEWASGADAVPIERLSMISDQRTIAMVSPDANIVWLCLPRLDSAAMFAELLGGPPAGRFLVRPADGSPAVKQEYVDGSLVLKTSFDTLSVTDFFDCSGGRPRQRAGRSDLIRIIEGSGRVTVEFAPRVDFGRTATRIHSRPGGLEVTDAPDPMVLRSPAFSASAPSAAAAAIDWEIVDEGAHQTARATIDLIPGTPVILELRYGIGAIRDMVPASPEVVAARGNAFATRRDATARFWSSWADSLVLPSVKPELVRQSALVLKGLIHGPTGAIAAAATSSLPEHIGGVRNWDYRFCWLRDAALAAASLLRLGSTSEALEYLDWVLGVTDRCESPERLRPLYTVSGNDLGPEGEIPELSGYRGSRPVRIGNGASGQVQLDVFGPIVELIDLLIQQDAPLSSEHWRLVEAMIFAVRERWQEPDHGIWEVRLPRQHHTHSKVMCWLAVDRAVGISELFLGRPQPDWVKLRDAIAAEVLERGFKPSINAFSAGYEVEEVDAAALLVGLRGLVKPDDPRFLGTVAAVESKLRQGPTVYRYHCDDGLPGNEGGFHLCTSWLVDAYLLCGRRGDAEALFEQYSSLAGPTGLLSEQYGPTFGRALGNHPQAYSHIGIIDNAVRLSAADD